MIFILHIDTSLEQGSVCLSRNGEMLQLITSTEQKEHASFIQPAIKQLLHQENISAKDLSVITVSNGPGSYTGLRVGMATAKGLCYALQIPLITIGTFDIMTSAAINLLKNSNETIAPSDLFCPMIDARRQEVYTALLNQHLDFINKPTAEIVSENTFIGQLNASKIFFYGNGSAKFKAICRHPNAQFINVDFNASHMITLSYQRFATKNFTDLAYSEPFYGKEFYSGIKP